MRVVDIKVISCKHLQVKSAERVDLPCFDRVLADFAVLKAAKGRDRNAEWSLFGVLVGFIECKVGAKDRLHEFHDFAIFEDHLGSAVQSPQFFSESVSGQRVDRLSRERQMGGTAGRDKQVLGKQSRA